MLKDVSEPSLGRHANDFVLTENGVLRVGAVLGYDFDHIWTCDIHGQNTCFAQSTTPRCTIAIQLKHFGLPSQLS